MNLFYTGMHVYSRFLANVAGGTFVHSFIQASCILLEFASLHMSHCLLQDVYIMYRNTQQVIVAHCGTVCCVVVFQCWCFVCSRLNENKTYLALSFDYLAKGRTNYELHPESYALRDGVAQTMTLFKPRLVTVHRPTCLFHQQQLAAAAAAAAATTASGTSKSSPATTPLRVRLILRYWCCYLHFGLACSHRRINLDVHHRLCLWHSNRRSNISIKRTHPLAISPHPVMI